MKVIKTTGAIVFAGLSIAACAPELPTWSRDATICVYDTLKATPGITKTDVYAASGSTISIIEYEYRDSKNQIQTATLLILKGIPERSSAPYRFAGGFSDYPDDPVNGSYNQIARKCQAQPDYLDQVMVIRPSDKVDMGNH